MDKELQEKYMQFKALEHHIQETTQQLEFFEEQATHLKDAVQSLEELEKLKVGTSMYVQLAHGVRVKANLADNKEVMVHVGADTTVHKTPKQAMELIKEQLQAIEHYQEKLTAKLMKLSEMADHINKG